MKPRKGIYPCMGQHKYVYRMLVAMGSKGLSGITDRPPAAYRIDDWGTMTWSEDMDTYNTSSYRGYPRIDLTFNTYYESTK